MKPFASRQEAREEIALLVQYGVFDFTNEDPTSEDDVRDCREAIDKLAAAVLFLLSEEKS